ncbi:MAG: DEAD/DEAH box helicase [Planctomycetaceae bacterium]|nr:DEAD/DEAH box helicase [Planctomycetaceae bacterium]MDG2390853.1 DEAD/DEAH box helicase [Planctomycetaceae bacterium]
MNTSEQNTEQVTFQSLDLIDSIQRALADENYETPTPIQAQTIPPALEGRDILGCAQTGTGKTAAFALPMLNKLAQNNRKATPNHPLALILAPTRELAIQIGESFGTYGRHINLRAALVYGGVSQHHQVKALRRGAHIVIATPGRLIDLMNQGHIKLSQLELFALDEADRMLDMGFLPDLKRIISQLPEQRQSMFFSATLAGNIVELTRSLLRDPVTVNVTPKNANVKKIEQRVMFVQSDKKLSHLEDILAGEDVDRALVFTKTKRTANMLSKELLRCGVNATAIHGNKSQNARQQALDAFRKRKVRVLVATDVAARGIDVDGITHVVNYDMPVEAESYVHRIGRTGRAGADGIAITLCTSGERRDLKAIERLIKQDVPVDPEHPFPQGGRGSYDGGGSSRKPRYSGNKQSRSRKPGARNSGGPRPSGQGGGQSSENSGGAKPAHRRKPNRAGRKPTNAPKS